MRKKSWKVCSGLILPRTGGSEIELFSPNITRATEQRMMRWAVHVARMGRREMHTEFWWGNLTDRDHLEDLGVDGKILRQNLPRMEGRRLD